MPVCARCAVLGLVALVLSALPDTAAARSRAKPVLASARLSLVHTLRDMMDVVTERYEVAVALETGPGGAAALHLVGTLEISEGSIDPGGRGGGRGSRAPRTVDVDERWTGSLRREQGALVVRFERSEAYRPVLEVDVEWRCVEERVEVERTPVRVWRCETAQTMTRPLGAAHPLATYLRVPLYLASPSARLRVDAVAMGGADHRSNLSTPRFSREPRGPARPSTPREPR